MPPTKLLLPITTLLIALLSHRRLRRLRTNPFPNPLSLDG